MKIPEKIRYQASDLIELFGENIEYLGRYKGQQVFLFILPADQENGFPVVYLYDPKADKIDMPNGMDALNLLEDVEPDDQ